MTLREIINTIKKEYKHSCDDDFYISEINMVHAAILGNDYNGLKTIPEACYQTFYKLHIGETIEKKHGTEALVSLPLFPIYHNKYFRYFGSETKDQPYEEHSDYFRLLELMKDKYFLKTPFYVFEDTINQMPSYKIIYSRKADIEETIKATAVFSAPHTLQGFDIENDSYPMSDGMIFSELIPRIKNLYT